MFTEEQNSFLLMAHFRSANRNEDGTWRYSLQSCIEQFAEKFPEVDVDYDTFRRRRQILIQRYEQKHCICKGKSTGRPTVITDQVVEDIKRRVEASPNKSIAKLSTQTGLSIGTCHKILTKNLSMKPSKHISTLSDMDPYTIVKDEDLEIPDEFVQVKQELTDESCETFQFPKEETDVPEDVKFNIETILPDKFTSSSSITHEGIASNSCSYMTRNIDEIDKHQEKHLKKHCETKRFKRNLCE